jgi:hypothetical protein
VVCWGADDQDQTAGPAPFSLVPVDVQLPPE